MVGSAARAASAPPNAWTAPLLSRASPECVPENSAASTTVLPAGSPAATLAPLPAIAPAASTAITVPSLAASSRTAAGTANRGPAVPALSQVVPSARRRSGPDATLTTSMAGASEVGATAGDRKSVVEGKGGGAGG